MSDAINNVVKSNMCAGCGLCAATANDMGINSAGFLRPNRIDADRAIERACPGIEVRHSNDTSNYNVTWGPLLRSRAGHAADPHVRFSASSGGILSALLQFLLETKAVSSVVQVGVSETSAIDNSTYVHGSTKKVRASAGSRYAPSAPLAAVRELIGDGNTYAFVGKPCDVSALRRFSNIRKDVGRQFPILISFMCAGVPSRLGTLKLLEAMGITEHEVSHFRYRGNGWPGYATALTKDGREARMSYNDSWGNILNKHLQPRCKLCADGIGEAADIVCADAWYQTEDGYPSFEDSGGRSLLLSRTDTGEKFVSAAINAGAIIAEDYNVANLEAIQPYQANRKRSFLARRLASIATFGSPPNFIGYAILANARDNGLIAFLKSFAATIMRRIRGRV